jgi:gliding motility-associated lipoprotein GldH
MIKRTNRIGVILISALCFCLLASCNKEVIFTDSVPMPEKSWSLSNITEFDIPVSDTINYADVKFIIRTGSDYPYRNIFLFVTTIAPDNKRITDTLEYDLADENGKWHGRGFGDIHELGLPYKSNVFFPLRGTYKFRIQHGMRIGDLKGVYDFGVRIEKTER